MNLLFVADVSIEKVIGGAERVLYEQTRRLARRGHRVHLITRRLPEHRRASRPIAGVTEIRCAFERSCSPVALRRNWRRVRQAWSALAARQPIDAVNLHHPVTAYGLLGERTAAAAPWIYTCHSLGFEEYLSRHPGGGALERLHHRIQALVRRHVERRVIAACGAVVALSAYTRGKLTRAYRIDDGRVRIIPGGVDVERFRPAPDKSAVRRRLGVPEGCFLALTVRNLVPRMGIGNLLEAFARAAAADPGLRLWIGGEGPLARPLAERAAALGLGGRVRFTGFIAETELAAHYQAADLFVLPTADLEGFGLVTLEALASGLPVLGTPVGATVEILGRLDRRLLLDDGRPESIAAGILAFRRDGSPNATRAAEWSARCRRFAVEHFSWERGVDALEALFARAAAERRAAALRPGG